MVRSGTHRAPPGGVRLAIPPEYRGRWLSNPADRPLIERWTSASHERCLYNAPDYIEFARTQNGRAELLWLVRDGHPVLGLPLHPVGDARITTGYSGLMFADAPGEAGMRRGVAALLALLAANRRLGFQALQSAQAPAYDDPARTTTLAFLFDRNRLRSPSLYSRILVLEPLADRGGAQPDVRAELLLEHGLRAYEPATRNQIRQAIRNGLQATCSLPRTEMEVHAVYGEFVRLHRESWLRTGMTPHTPEFWRALARAILGAGGRDLVIFARDGDGMAMAAVLCHLQAGRALYWAGASSAVGQGLRANPLCLHAAIQACRQLGVRHFELGRFHARERSRKELAITSYKAQFGGELVPVGGFNTRAPVTTVSLCRARGMLRRARGAAGRARRRSTG